MTAAPAEADRPTIDAFLGGLVTLIQPKDGHRAGLDAALLQALVPEDGEGLAVELGAGVGTVAFCAAVRAKNLSVIGIERDAQLVALGLAALERPGNAGLAGRVRLFEGDAETPRAIRDLVGDGADWVLMNPPFDIAARVSSSPDARRRGAHVGAAGLLEAWCKTAALLLKPGGRLGLIHRAAALPEVLAALGGRFGGVSILPVHPSRDTPASRILVAALRASRAPPKIAPGLVLHAADGGWTPAADAILRGETALRL